MSEWVFSELRRDEARRDPNEAELFKADQAAEGEYAGTDALVREVIQNSIDAADGSGPVRVRMAIHEAKDAPPIDRLAYYFSRLQPALKNRGLKFDTSGLPKMGCRFLVVEDFNTRGLEGDPRLFRDPSDGSRQDFYWFWRNIGRSGKTGLDLGRWGLGKTVYRAVSRVGCMLGLTVRRSDKAQLLMGQAVLKIHEFQGRAYKAEGFWCGGQEDGLPLAIMNRSELRRFRGEWRLTRDDEPGLSVVSPYIPEGLCAERLLQTVAIHFFARILRGELEVEVCGPNLGSITLNRESLADKCRRMTWNGPTRAKRHLPPPIGFAGHCLAAEPDVETRLLGVPLVPKWDPSTIDDELLSPLRERYGSGEPVGVRVNLALPQKSGPPEQGDYTIWVQRSATGERGESYFVREGMTITKITSRASRHGVNALVLVDRGPLAELLGDTEGPAHEDWNTSAERPKERWKAWVGRVDFVRRSVDGLVELLTASNGKADRDALKQLFSVNSVPVGRQGRTQSPPRPEIPPPAPKWYYVAACDGGFTIRRNPSVEMPKNAELRVALAYDIPQGNPLAKWSPLDFVIKRERPGLVPTGTGAHVKLLSENSFLLRDIKEDFTMRLVGFDENRDLYVKVDDVDQESEGVEVE